MKLVRSIAKITLCISRSILEVARDIENALIPPYDQVSHRGQIFRNDQRRSSSQAIGHASRDCGSHRDQRLSCRNLRRDWWLRSEHCASAVKTKGSMVGMGPIRLSEFEENALARRALCRKDASKSTVTQIATDQALGAWPLRCRHTRSIGETPRSRCREYLMARGAF